MKKLIGVIMMAIIAGTMSLTAFAATDDDGDKLDKRIEMLVERQQSIAERVTKNEEKQTKLASLPEQQNEFRKSLIENRQSILDDKEENLSLVVQRNQLRLKLLQTLDTMKEDGLELSAEAITQLKEYKLQVRELTNALKDTKGQNKAIAAEKKVFIKDKDFAAMDTAFGQISATQAARHEMLIKINELLLKMNELVSSSSTAI